jgi:hypothetical protein
VLKKRRDFTMRLTLRTLLAYLDDVLDPGDKEELAQKIESSEFAEDLVHRTRDTVRRLRLSAPQVVGTGTGLDPNSVAEYLDNVMPPDQVGDYERICLESDVHLAEAAACHHVLTMILGSPADVDPLARQRMYTIATEARQRRQLRTEPAHPLGSTQVTVAPPTAPAVVVAPAPRQPVAIEIPDYLRTTAWWRSRGALVVLAAAVFIGLAVFLASGLRGWLGGRESVAVLTPDSVAANNESAAAAPPIVMDKAPASDASAEPVATNTGQNNGNTTPPLGPPPQPMTPGVIASTTTSATADVPDRYAPSSVPNAAAPATPPVEPPAADQARDSNPVPPTPPAPPTANTTPPGAATANVPAESVQPPIDAPSTPLVASTTPPKPIPPPASAPVESPPGAATVDTAPAAPPADAPGVVAGPAPPLAATGPAELGTYMGAKTVLLRYDEKAGTWYRIEPRAAVVTGERLLALPEFRPKIALLSGLHLDLSGGTQVVMGAAGEGAAGALAAVAPTAPGVEVVYGRIVLINPTNGDNEVRLIAGPSVSVAKLGRNATLAVEVERKYIPGNDPRKAPAPVEIRLFAPDGGVVWQDAAGPRTIDKASRWSITAQGASEVAADPSPPEWIDHEPIVQLSEQRFGAPLVESTLVSNAPVETQLLELFQGSGRKEVKSLVARSSVYVGLFQTSVDALRDSEQKANWRTHIETLRSAMAMSPEAAERVWQTLVEQRGRPAASDLYEMLCGYRPDQIGQTADQMKLGAVATLINRLEDDSLDYRVLAWNDLREITGKQHMPNPAAPLAERTRNVRVWRARLEAGDLKPIAQPQP